MQGYKNSKNIKSVFKVRLLESTSLIALITLSLYFFSYLFKLGYYSYYNVPSNYISFDLNNIAPFGIFFIALIFIVAFLLIIAIISIFISERVLNLEKSFEQKLKKNGFSEKGYNIVMLIIMLVIMLLPCLVIIWSFYTNQMRLSHFIWAVGLLLCAGVYYLLIKIDERYSVLKLITTVFSVMVITFVGSLSLGDYHAKNLDYIMTTTVAEKKYMIIDLYDKKYYLVKEFDGDNLENSFELIDLKDVQKITYEEK